VATKTLYPLWDSNAAGSTKLVDMQDGGTAPATATMVTGWTVGTTVATRYAEMTNGAKVAAASFGTTALPDAAVSNANGDSCRSPSAYSGVFANSNWVFNFACARSAGTNSGSWALRMRVFASTDATGATGLRELTGSTQVSGTVTTAASMTGSLTWTPGATVRLNNEYLFFSLAMVTVTAASNSSTAIAMGKGSGTTIVTPDFVADTVITPSVGAASVSGAAPTMTRTGGDTPITPSVGSAALAGVAPTLSNGVAITPSAGAVSAAGVAGTNGRTTTPSAGSLSIAGVAPGVTRQTTIAPAAGSVTAAGSSSLTDLTLTPSTGSAAVTGQAPTVSQSATVHTFYLLPDTAASFSGAAAIQSDGAAPAAANATAGFNPGTASLNKYQPFQRGVVAGPSLLSTTALPDTTIDDTNGNTFRTSSQYTGQFDGSSSWFFNFAFVANRSGDPGRMAIRVRVFAASDPSGAGAREITTATLETNAIANANATEQFGTVTWAPGSFRLDQEYLFFSIANRTTVTPNSTALTWTLRSGSTYITTDAFAVTTVIQPAARNLSLTGGAGTADIVRTATPGTGAAAVSGQAATRLIDAPFTPGAAALTVSGQAGGTTAITITPGAAALSVAGQAADVTDTGQPLQLYFLPDTTLGSGFAEVQSDPPASGTSSTGWNATGINAAPQYSPMARGVQQLASTFSAAVLPDTTLDAAHGDAFVLGFYRGQFAAGNWTISFAADVTLNQSYALTARLLTSPNSDGSGATDVGGGVLSSNTLTGPNSGTSSGTFSITFNPGAISCDPAAGVYLFLSIAIEVTVKKGGSHAVFLDTGASSYVLTSAFQGQVLSTPAAASVSIAGYAPTAAIVRETTPFSGAASVAGVAPTAVVTIFPIPQAGSAAITGAAPTVLLGALLIPTAGSVVASGQAGTVGGTKAPSSASATISGAAPTLAMATVPGAGAIALAGAAGTIGVTVTPGAGSVATAGVAPTRIAGAVITPAVGSVSVSGVAGTRLVNSLPAPLAGSASIAGASATVQSGAVITPAAGAISAAGVASSSGVTVTPAASAVASSGAAAAVTTQFNRTPVAGAAALSLVAPAVTQQFNIAPSSGGVAATGQAPTIAETGLFTWYMDDGVSFFGQTFAKLTQPQFSASGYLSSTGWNVLSVSSAQYAEFQNATMVSSFSAGARPSTTAKLSTGNALISNGEYGSFAAGTWVFNFKLQGYSDGARKPQGYLRVRVFKGAVDTGVDQQVITELTDSANIPQSALFGDTGWSGTDLTVNVPITWNASAFTLAEGEYLYVKVAILTNNNANGTSATWSLYYNIGQSSILTAPFQQNTNMPSIGGGGPFTATATLTGNQASLTRQNVITPAVGAVTSSGQVATRVVDFPRAPAAGAISATGAAGTAQTVTFIAPGAAAVSASGQTATSVRGSVQTTGAGSASVSGASPSAVVTTFTTPSSGAIAAAGGLAGVTQQTFLATSTATANVIGQAPTVGVQRFATPGRGSVAIGSADPIVQLSGDPPATGAADLDGQLPTLFREDSITTATGGAALSGGIGAPSIGFPLTPARGSVSIVGRVPGFDTGISDGADAAAVDGVAAVVIAGSGAYPAGQDVAIDGQAPVLALGEFDAPPAAALAVSGGQAIVVAGRVLTPSGPPMVAMGGDWVSSFGAVATPGAGAMQASGTGARIVRFDAITPGGEPAMVITGKAPVLVRGRVAMPGAGSMVAAGAAPTRTVDQARQPGAGQVAVAAAAAVAVSSTIPVAGAMTALGQAATVIEGAVLTPGRASMGTTSYAPGDAVDAGRQPGAGQVSLAGAAPLVVGSTVPDTAAALAVGLAPVIVRGNVVQAAAAAIAVTGAAPARVTDHAARPGSGTVAPSSAAAVVVAGRVVTPAAAALSVTGRPGAAPSNYALTPGAGAVVTHSEAVSEAGGIVVTPPAGRVDAAGAAPVPGYTRAPSAAAVSIVSAAPRVAFDHYITPAAGQVSIVGRAPGAAGSQVMVPAAAAIASSSGAPTIGRDTPITPAAGTVTLKPGRPHLGAGRGADFKLTDGGGFKLRNRPQPGEQADSFALKRDATMFKLEKDDQ
jgi:hypothetical protein